MASDPPSPPDAVAADPRICPLCLEPVRQPTVLPCLHTYCRGCLEGLRGGGRGPRCPECRAGAGAPGPACTLCPLVGREAPRPAVSRCLDCADRLCRACAAGHRCSRLTHAHRLVALPGAPAPEPPWATPEEALARLLAGAEETAGRAARGRAALEEELEGVRRHEAGLREAVRRAGAEAARRVLEQQEETLSALRRHRDGREEAAGRLRAQLERHERLARGMAEVAREALARGRAPELASLGASLAQQLGRLRDFRWEPLGGPRPRLVVGAELRSPGGLFRLDFGEAGAEAGAQHDVCLRHSPSPSPEPPGNAREPAAPSPEMPLSLWDSPAPSPEMLVSIWDSPASSPEPPASAWEPAAPSPEMPLSLRDSLAPSPEMPVSLRDSPAPSPAMPVSLRDSPASSPKLPVSVWDSPAPSLKMPVSLRDSPAPSPDPPASAREPPAPSPKLSVSVWDSPAPSLKMPISLRDSPAPSPEPLASAGEPSAPSPKLPVSVWDSPAPSLKTPASAREPPAPSPKLPVSLRDSPAPSPKTPASARQTPAPSPKLPVSLQDSPAPSPAPPPRPTAHFSCSFSVRVPGDKHRPRITGICPLGPRELLLADEENRALKRFSPQGDFRGAVPVHAGMAPCSVAAVGGRVAYTAGSRLYLAERDGALVWQKVLRPTQASHALAPAAEGGEAMAVSVAGHLEVYDARGELVEKIFPDGHNRLAMVFVAGRPGGYVASDWHRRSVVAFDSHGQVAVELGEEALERCQPGAVCADARGYFYVVLRELNKVVAFGPAGEPLGPVLTARHGLEKARVATVTGHGHLAVALSNGTVHVFRMHYPGGS